MFVTYVVTSLIGAVLFVVLYVTKKLSYWKSRGVYQRTQHFIYGDAKLFFKQQISIGEHLQDLYNEFKSKDLRFGGSYVATTPCLVLVDPDIIKAVIQTDFNHFSSHGFYVNEEVDPLTGHLFNLDGPRWKSMRTKLTPTFTSGKMKMMFDTLVACTEGLIKLIDQTKSGGAVEISEVLGRFTTDIIVSCAFGLNCNSMEDPQCEFTKYGKKSFERTKSSLFKVLAIRSLPRSVIHWMRIKITPPDVENFFMNVVKNTVKYRETNNIYRKDFMHLLLQLKNRGKISNDDKISADETSESALTMNELAAQCFVFFIAGFETSSSAMSFALYELALNQNIQNTLREEIDDVLKKHDGKLTYDSVKDMVYLDRVVRETLRKHPPAPVVPRECSKEYKIPGTDLIIEPQVKVHVSVLGLHRDPEYYPDPEKFDPDRFTEENISKRPQYTFLPFGEGPRICIGLRFGIMQTKVGLISIIKNYKITLNEKTAVPLKLDPSKFISSAKNGIWLNVAKLT